MGEQDGSRATDSGDGGNDDRLGARASNLDRGVPGNWDSLILHQSHGNLCSIDRVADELRRGDDELSRRAVESLGETAFMPTNDAETVARYTDLIIWAQAQSQFLDYAKEQFAQVADG
jgi:hypothetical protein